MLTFIIRPFIRGTMLISRNALKSVPENRRNIRAEDLQEHNSEHKKFLDCFPEIVSAFTKGESLKIFPDVEEFVTKLLQYNSAAGKKTYGLMTVTAYQMLEKPENLFEGSMRQARTLGWCIELLQTCMLLMDDIIDNSTTRRGALCWYRRPDVGTRAVNDTSLLLALIFEQLKVNFSEKQYYPELIRVFNEAVSQISIGQYLDFVAVARNIDSFNEKNYTNIAVFKTVYYTFKLPVYVSLLLANKSCDDAYKNEKELLKEMGILTLMQNDFLDCFGDEKVVGKAGTDIQEGKCTWLAVQALARGGDAARAQLEACYGRSDEASARRVRTLYERLRLPQLYRDTEQAARKKILKQIDAIPADNIVPPALIRKLFHMVYHIPTYK